MQEEVTQKTIALYVKVGKGAARLTEQALQKAIQKFLEQKSKPAHGKQTMRQLMKQNAGVSNIEITDSNIKAFESTAKKYNIDFSLKKVKGEQTVKSNMVYTLCKHMVYMLSITNEHKNELEIRAKPEWKVHFLCFASAKRGSFSIR